MKEKKRNPSASPIVTLVTCVHSVQQCNGSYMKKISALQEKSPPVEKKRLKNEKKIVKLPRVRSIPNDHVTT